MKKLMHNWFITFSLGLLFLIGSPLAISCSSEDDAQPQIEEENNEEEEEEKEELNINEYYISNLKVEDISNLATAEDLLVSFRTAIKTDSISEYRIIVIPSAQSNDLTTSNATNLDQDRYFTVVNDKSSYEFMLQSSLLDFNGNAIVEDVEYKIAVVTIGVHYEVEVIALSELSNEIVIDYDLMVSTLVQNLDGNDAISVDNEGNIYVSNFGGYTPSGGTGTTVIKITPEGESSVFVDGLTGPLGSAFDSEGNFYVINGNNGSSGEILKVSSTGDKTSLAVIDGWPAGIVIDKDNNLYISNYSAPNIHKLSNTGDLSVFATDSKLSGCVGIVMDENGNIITGNYNNGRILSIDTEGNVSQLTQITGLPSQFALGYIAINDQKIYATGIGDNKIYEITMDGQYSVLAGDGASSSVDGQFLYASFKNPNGIGVDNTNKKMYVVDWGSRKLRVLELAD